jgi:hypothetical protein
MNCGGAYLLLREIVRQVCNHDLVLGWNAIGRRTPLTTLTGLTGFTGLTGLTRLSLLLFLVVLAVLLSGGLVRGFGKRKDLASSRSLSTFLTAGLIKLAAELGILEIDRLTPRAARPPRPPRPRPRPRPRPDGLRRPPSPPETPSPPLAAPSPFSGAGSGLRASWTETLRSRISLPESSAIARSASLGVERSTKA